MQILDLDVHSLIWDIRIPDLDVPMQSWDIQTQGLDVQIQDLARGRRKDRSC